MILLKIIKTYWKSLTVLGAIFYLSFASPSSFPKIPTFPFEDKIIHALMYAGLSFVLMFDFNQAELNNNNLFKFVLICLFFPIITGGLVEIAQGLFFAPRSPSTIDWIADIIGVLLGWLAFKTIYPYLKKIKL